MQQTSGRRIGLAGRDDLRAGLLRAGVVFRIRHNVFIAKSLLRKPQEPLVVIARHGDVDIVIPRDEAGMAARTERGARVEEVRDAMFAAHRIDGERISSSASCRRRSVSSSYCMGSPFPIFGCALGLKPACQGPEK